MSGTLALIAALMSVTACVVAADAPAAETTVQFHPHGDETITLEGRLHVPEGAEGVAAVVLCHPDPRYGGSMDVPVVTHLQRTFAAGGYATLRFNLRGVGASTGTFDDGKGEMLDCLGALDFLRRQEGVDRGRLALVGYSYGSWVGLRACVKDAKVRACACLCFPVPDGEEPDKHEYFTRLRFPVLFVTGTEDTISSLKAIREIIQAHEAGKHCRVISLEGADHFLRNPADLESAAGCIVQFVKEHTRPEAAPVAQDTTP